MSPRAGQSGIARGRFRARRPARGLKSVALARSQPPLSFLFRARAFLPSPSAPPPCRRAQSGYRGVRTRPNGTFTAEIRSADERVSLGTFDTAEEAARPRAQMNFGDCRNAREAAARAPAPCLVTAEDRHLHRRRAIHRLVAERDQRAVEAWYASHPREAAEERELWETREAERAERRAERHEWREERRVMKATAEAELASGNANWPADDPCWSALEEDISNTEDDVSDDDDEE